MEFNKECTCFKIKINGRCDVCKEHYLGIEGKKAKDLIEKYPNQVNCLIYEF